jgi:hypothetical protein
MAIYNKHVRTLVYRGEADGAHRITGTTKTTGTPELPVRRRVRLHDQPTGRPLREVWSDATTGAYSFDNIRQGTFYITAFDHTGSYGGVIETDVTPEPMP